MENPSTSPRAPASLFWLAGVVTAFGLAAVLCALLPSDWLHRLSERAGHGEDVTSERIVRLRVIGVGLAMCHGLLASFLLTWGRSRSGEFLREVGREIVSASPLAAIRRARNWFSESGWFHVAALVIVLATAVVIRLKYLDVPMDYDEAYSFLNYASRPLYQGLADYNSTNNHLLNTGFMHVAHRMFGPREWALRLHVFAAGVGLVGSTYVLGRRLHCGETGLVAAALVATSYVMINYSVNARGYVWAAWMTVLLVHAFWRIGNAEPKPRSLDWLAAGFVAVVGIFAIPTMVYSIAGCAAWLTIRALRLGRTARSMLFGLGVWSLLVGLASLWLYAPALIFRGVSAWRHPFVSPERFSDWIGRAPCAWLYALKSGTDGPATWLVPGGFMFIGLIALWILKRRGFLLLVAVPVAALALMAVQQVAPPPRVFSFLSPLFALLAGGGLVATLQFIGLPHAAAAAERSARGINAFCCLIAIGLCALSYSATRKHLLPGGLRPTFLVEDVGEFWGKSKNPRAPSHNQLWRLGVPEAVAIIEPYVRKNDRVLVGLPADLPFHFYAAQRRWRTPIGGRPVPGERLFLVIRNDEDPRVALRENLSLGFTEPWILDANWQTMASGDLAVWLAQPASAATTESDSR
jgi:hypothetical protein